MVKSMTGYGRHESVLHGRTLVIEVKSVNNRYLDCNVRLPRVCICAEDGVQRRVKEVISRGKVDVYVNMENNTEEAVSVTLNQPVAAGYMEALRKMAETFGLAPAAVQVPGRVQGGQGAGKSGRADRGHPRCGRGSPAGL